MSDESCTCLSEWDAMLEPRGQRVPITFMLDKGTLRSLPLILAEFRPSHKKKRGERALVLAPTFCPFCGTKYPRTAEPVDSAEDEPSPTQDRVG